MPRGIAGRLPKNRNLPWTDLRCSRRLLEPPRPVVVRRNDRWHGGEERAWRREGAGWLGFFCYAESARLRCWNGSRWSGCALPETKLTGRGPISVLLDRAHCRQRHTQEGVGDGQGSAVPAGIPRLGTGRDARPRQVRPVQQMRKDRLASPRAKNLKQVDGQPTSARGWLGAVAGTRRVEHPAPGVVLCVKLGEARCRFFTVGDPTLELSSSTANLRISGPAWARLLI
jgi:hypothetical protein